MIIDSSLYSNPYESSIQQLMEIEGRKKARLQDQQNSLEGQKSALSDIDSKLSSLNTLLTSFLKSTNEKLQPLSGTSSNPEAVSVVSTDGMTGPNNYSMFISSTAKRDIVSSEAVNQTGTDYNATGTGSFDIAIGSGAASTITVNTAGLNNQEVLEATAKQINDQLGDQIKASVYKLGDGTSKLSFKSTETGAANELTISNKQGDLSSLTTSSRYSGSQLNAQFTIDGISFERSSNLIDDVVSGLTFEIHRPESTKTTLDIKRDTEEAKNNIQSFIDQFNATNEIIRNKTFLNGDTGDRGPLQEERSIRNLSYNMRTAASLPVDSLSGSGLSSLRNIGIELSTNGTMKIADSAALDEALKNNPEGVAKLFSTTDGIAASLQQEITTYISGDANIFDSIENGIEQQIDRIGERIENEEEYLARKEEQLRDQFNALNQIITRGESQFNQVLNFQNKLSF